MKKYVNPETLCEDAIVINTIICGSNEPAATPGVDGGSGNTEGGFKAPKIA